MDTTITIMNHHVVGWAATLAVCTLCLGCESATRKVRGDIDRAAGPSVSATEPFDECATSEYTYPFRLSPLQTTTIVDSDGVVAERVAVTARSGDGVIIVTRLAAAARVEGSPIPRMSSQDGLQEEEIPLIHGSTVLINGPFRSVKVRADSVRLSGFVSFPKVAGAG